MSIHDLHKELASQGVLAVVVADDASSVLNTEAIVEAALDFLGAVTVTTHMLQRMHWMLVDRDFVSIHEWLGKQYEFWFSTQDTIAEHIRTLAFHHVIPDLANLMSRGSPILGVGVADVPGDAKDFDLDIYYRVLCELRNACVKICLLSEAQGLNTKAPDYATLDLFSGLIRDIDKAKWFTQATMTR